MYLKAIKFLLFAELFVRVECVTEEKTVPQICQEKSTCGSSSDCYTTCDNPCKCPIISEKLPFPLYGGQCQDTGFCEREFLHLEDCIEEGGPSCPTMVGMEEALDTFSTFDFRVDVRSEGEWNDGHANISIHTPGLAKTPAANYTDQLEGLYHKKILVYCRSGGRAFEASQNLLKYGFSNIHSFYHGGFPNIRAGVEQQSEQSGNHPTKNFCYLSGGSDICPIPLPVSHITNKADLVGLGEKVILVDVRPPTTIQSERLPKARRVHRKIKIKNFLMKLNEKNDKEQTVLVLFCEKGNAAFAKAKQMKEMNDVWNGKIYWVDNGGYNNLAEIIPQGI